MSEIEKIPTKELTNSINQKENSENIKEIQSEKETSSSFQDSKDSFEKLFSLQSLIQKQAGLKDLCKK